MEGTVMKKIIISLSIIGVLNCSMQTNAMQPNSSQGGWIRPALAGATALGGLCTGYFWNKNRKLKKPSQPQKPKESNDLKETTENFFNLLNIQMEGRNFTKHQEHYENNRNGLLTRFRQLKFSFTFGSENSPYETNQRIMQNLKYGFADPYIREAFNADKQKREDLKKGILGRKNAIEAADFTDEQLEKHRKKKDELEKQQKEQQEKYEKDNGAYPRVVKQYNSQVRINRTFMALGAGATGLGAALLYFGKKK